jgi:hypothetical protein
MQVTDDASEDREVEYYQLPGIACGPTKEDRAASIDMRGYRVVVASHNYRVNVEVEAGQTRVYSTPADGSEVVSEIDLQTDGTIGVKTYDSGSPKAEIELLADGQATYKNDAGAEVVLHTDGLIEQKNGSQSLKTLIDSLIDELIAFRTTGSPTNHTTDPGTVTNLTTIKTNFGGLLK